MLFAPPGAGLETADLSLDFPPLGVGIDEPKPPVTGPSLVGGAAPDLSVLFLLPKKNDIVTPLE